MKTWVIANLDRIILIAPLWIAYIIGVAAFLSYTNQFKSDTPRPSREKKQ